jgi:cell division protein FtsB
MKTTAWNLIVLAPEAGLQKLHLSYRACMILIGAFVFGFCVTVALLLMFPRLQVNESEHARLAAENQMLKVENKNLTLQIHKLDAQVVRVEERSKQVIALTQID